MDENYYRSLIDKVRKNEERMWSRNESPDDGFDDFAKLWDIINDNEAAVSPQTYFEAMDLCMNSFFGTTQDPKVVWDSIVRNYQQALKDSDIEEFRDAFVNFSETNSVNEKPDCIAQFTKMMRIAIDAEDMRMATAITVSAFSYDVWTNENDYPQWSVWYAVFLDKPFGEVPHTSKVEEAINELYSKFSDNPEMERLGVLHNEYFKNC